MITRTGRACLLGLAGLLGASLASAPLSAEDTPDWSFTWSNGFKLDSPDGDVRLGFGGRIQNDWAWFSADEALAAAVGTFDDGSEFRRARLFFQGELYGRVELRAQYDFAGGGTKVNDLYLGLVHLPGVGGIRIGHVKEPYSLEDQTSSKYFTFMERSLASEAFTLARNLGVLLHREEERYTWAVGAFLDADDSGNAVDRDQVNLTGRVTGLPWYSDGGGRLLHLGLSVSERRPTADSLRFRARPESHLATRVVDTGTFGADGLTQVNVEAALVQGRFSLQGEHTRAMADGLGGVDDPDFDGFYVFASWFVTGEHRPYETGAGAFGRVKPEHAWRDGGKGAWEVALRYSTLDLADGGVDGGSVDDVTLGVNWFPFANVRWSANYVLSDRDDLGQVDVFETRFQVDF